MFKRSIALLAALAMAVPKGFDMRELDRKVLTSSFVNRARRIRRWSRGIRYSGHATAGEGRGPIERATVLAAITKRERKAIDIHRMRTGVNVDASPSVHQPA